MEVGDGHDVFASMWRLTIDLEAFQAFTDVAVSIPADAPGFSFGNAPSNRAFYTFVPATAASASSILSCASPLTPPTSIRRDGAPAVCTLSMRDAAGDPAKGILSLFVVNVGAATATPLVVTGDGSEATFQVYAPPATGGSTVLVSVMFAGTKEAVVGSPWVLDVADYPTDNSMLFCSSGQPFITIAAYGQVLTCTITVRNSAGFRKALPSDFGAVVTMSGDAASFVVAHNPMLATTDGGLTYSLEVLLEAPGPLGIAPRVDVDVTTNSGGVTHVRSSFLIAEVPAADVTVVECTPAVPFNPLEEADLAAGISHTPPVAYVSLYEFMECEVHAAVASATGAVVSSLVVPELLDVFTDLGTVSPLEVAGGGGVVTFRYFAPANGTNDTLSVVGTRGSSRGRAMGGTPLNIRLHAHELTPPYMRCDTREYPPWSLGAGDAVQCYLFGMPSDVPSGLRVFSPTADGVAGEIVEPTSPTASVWFTTRADRANTTATIAVEADDVVFGGSPVELAVAGRPTPDASRLECAVSTTDSGHVLRGSTVNCTIHALHGAYSVFTHRSQFQVSVAGGEATVLETDDGTGHAWRFLVSVSSNLQVFATTIRASLAGGPYDGQDIVGSTIEYQLTDAQAPTWDAERLPHVVAATASSITMEVSVDEASRLCVTCCDLMLCVCACLLRVTPRPYVCLLWG